MLAPGTRLGPYTIVGVLGVGGMGEVYRAHDDRLHREVAIKVLPENLAADRQSLERFRREARAVAALSHPNILSIFDFGSDKGIEYAVTELLEGETLRSRVHRSRLAAREALETLLAISEGVAAAHERGIVHRDLKPENVFVTKSGRIKVLDFGLARAADPLATPPTDAITEMLPTQPGIVVGTVGYLAPEQVDGRPATPASDVFSLGCMLYEMVSGRLPFERASSVSAMVALLHDPAPRLEKTGESLLRDVDALIQHCLAKSPADRPQSAGDLVKLVRSVLRGEHVPRLARRGTTSSYVVAAAIAGVVVAGLIAAFLLIRHARNRQVDEGYDIRVSDIRADAETQRLIELALRADAAGNRPNAQELFKEAARRNAPTAFPTAFLSSFAEAAGDDVNGRKWAAEATKHLDSATPTYESLLVRYLTVQTGDQVESRELSLAKAALDLRPAAWRLHLAAAHIHLSLRDNAAALRELKAIDIRKPDDRRLMLVLADRASLGDAASASRDVARTRLGEHPAFLHYTQGRIAWSSGNPRAAVDLYHRAAEEAAAESLPWLDVEARLLAGVALVSLDERVAAQRDFAAANVRARQSSLAFRVFEAAALDAYAAHLSGDFEERDQKLIEAYGAAPESVIHAIARLLAIRLRSEVWKSWSADEFEHAPEFRSVSALMHAREAWFRGDLPTAARELRRARSEGIDSTYFREEAELLDAELGQPSHRIRFDPPYPNLVRFPAVNDLDRLTIRSNVEK